MTHHITTLVNLNEANAHNKHEPKQNQPKTDQFLHHVDANNQPAS